MPKKRLGRLSNALRTRHYSYRTEEAYLKRVRRNIIFHHKRHPTQHRWTKLPPGNDEIIIMISNRNVKRNCCAFVRQ